MLAFFSIVIAAGLSGVSAKCAAMPQVDNCVQTTTAYRIATCGPNDYQCQCDGYNYIASCFLPCPGDPEVTQMALRFDGLKQTLCASASLTQKAPETTSSAQESSLKPSELDSGSNKPSSSVSKPEATEIPSSASYNFVSFSSVAIVALFLVGQ